jgi:hypothetical protein
MTPEWICFFDFGVIDFAERPEVNYQNGQVAGFVGWSSDMPNASRTGKSIFFSAWNTAPPSRPWVPEPIASSPPSPKPLNETRILGMHI